ncbi:MAG: DHH family phosphoesterase [Bacilli bacterium]|jgi:c-di-AMP phosphodiesterase-like protein
MFDLIKGSKIRWLIIYIIEIVLVGVYIAANRTLGDEYSFFKSDTFVFILLGLLMILPMYAGFFSVRSFEKAVRKNYITITNTLGADISEAYSFGEMGLIIYNDKREIIWSSNIFTERGIKVLGLTIDQRFPNLKAFFENGDGKQAPETLREKVNQRIYEVMQLAELNVLIFKDISEVDNLYKLRKDEAPVFTMILLDNLLDVANIAADDEYVQIEALIRKTIADWSKEFNVVIKKIKEDSYFGIMSEESYVKIRDGEFKIINDVSKLSSHRDIVFTISLGFGRGIQNFSKLSELAAAAIDVAQSRGGGQVVVNNFGGRMEFFGGAGTEVKMRRNAVRNKVLAQSFFAHVQTYQSIYILVHTEADFDAIGAALGIVAIANAANRPAVIVYDEKQVEVKARMMLKELFSKNELDIFSLSPAKAIERINSQSLVVVVDVNRASITTAPKILEIAKNVAVIDHHRKAEDAIDEPIFSHIDTNASSASELVTEMIMNTQVDVKITPKVATYMLAGILMDTNGFKARTSAATFKAAMNLKDFGADNSIADSYLKDEFEEFVLKTKIMSTIESPYFGIIIATAPTNQAIGRTMLAKVGQELISVKGVRAVFVVGNISDKVVGISARSNGTVNVQLIMEKMGGGGHHSASATQISNEKIENVLADLKRILGLYINDITWKEPGY